MLSTQCFKTCYLLRIPFFFFWDISQQYHKKFVYILVVIIIIANVFKLYVAIGLLF